MDEKTKRLRALRQAKEAEQKKAREFHHRMRKEEAMRILDSMAGRAREYTLRSR